MSPLVWFLAVAMFSPGPNIIMLTSSGARFGARATAPHLAGVVLGVGVIGAVSGLGIGALILAEPRVKLALQIAAFLWILWMAWALYRADDASGNGMMARPMRFHEAVLFQWVNPKIWAIALAASSGYSIGLAPLQEAARLGVNFSSVNFFVCGFWTIVGAALAHLLNSPSAWYWFRVVMAAFLGLSALMVFA